MTQVIGFRKAMACIHPGMADRGTNAELRKIIGKDRKPSIEKKSPWLLTENAIAREMAVRPMPNIIPITKITAIPKRPVIGVTPNKNAMPKMTKICMAVMDMTNKYRLRIIEVR